jgi:hypothetical protein
MAKKWKDLTEDEKQEAIALNERLHKHQKTVHVFESVLDEMLVHLKTAKRRRPAPGMLYQYPGLDPFEFDKMIVRYQEARSAEKAASDELYKRAPVMLALARTQAI